MEDTADGQARIVIQGSINAINAAITDFVYDNNIDVHTMKLTETLSVSVDDVSNGGGGAATTESSDINIKIIELNDAIVKCGRIGGQ